MRLTIMLAVALLATMGTAFAAGIPLEAGGIVLADPWGKGPDGEELDMFPAGTLTVGFALAEEPEALTLGTLPQFLLANTRFEILGYSERVATETDAGTVYENKAEITGGISLNVLAAGQMTKAGIMYYPNSEWHTAGYVGIDLLALMPEPIVPGLSLAPQYTSGGLGFLAHYTTDF